MTLRDLRKQAREDGFIDKMKELGFKVSKNSFWFYRQRGMLIDYIAFWIASSGNWVEVPIVCFTESMLKNLKEYDMNLFPKGLKGEKVPYYSDMNVSEDGVEFIGDSWKVDKTLFKKLEVVIEENANPWLLNINTNEKVFNSFSPRFKEGELGLKLKKILL